MTMQVVSETHYLEQLWAHCQKHGWRMTVARVNPTANGIDDRFTLRVTRPDGAYLDATTTNIESAATLILDRIHKRRRDA